MNAAPLALADVHKSFGPKAVLRGLTSEIPGGEIFAIVGPSGAGKTTTLRLLDLLEVPDGGEVRIHGKRFAIGSPEALEQRRRMAMVFVGLLDMAREPATALSGGEQQRIAFARAAVLQPEILLLDEFTANLDPTNVRILEEAILRYRKETGCTIVIVTHNLFQARRLADRVALLLDGRFVEVAPAPSFFEEPGRPETRAFLSGEMAY